MKWIFAIVLFAVVFWYFGFHGRDAFFRDYSGQGGSFVGRELCTAVRNPFDANSAQYRGFDLAQKSAVSYCADDHSSFTQGCQEYTRQLTQYQACVSKNRLPVSEQ